MVRDDWKFPASPLHESRNTNNLWKLATSVRALARMLATLTETVLRAIAAVVLIQAKDPHCGNQALTIDNILRQYDIGITFCDLNGHARITRL